MCDLHICRICLNTAVRGYKLDEHSLRNYYEYVMRRNLTSEDELPQWLCYECVVMLLKIQKFKEKCIQGEHVLRQIAFRGHITYDLVAMIDRCSENLLSSIGFATESNRVHTTIAKHRHSMTNPEIKTTNNKLNINPQMGKTHSDIRSTINDKYDDTDSSVSSEDEQLFDEILIKPEVIITEFLPPVTSSDPIESGISDSVKTEKNLSNAFDTNNFKNINNDIEKHNSDLKDDNHDLDNDFDMTENFQSSDDESLVETAKKQDKVKHKTETEKTKTEQKEKSVKRGNNEEVVLKNTQPLKHVLDPQFWTKINLSEEEAIKEFKQREFSDHYVTTKHKCKDCLKGFSKMDMLVRHLKRRHDKSNPVECRFCHMRFRLKHLLAKHIKEHLVIYNCLFCKLQCTRLSNAISHQERHQGTKKTCKLCGKEFNHLSTYYTHVRMSHRSAHVCVACGASFVSELGLQQHTKLKHFDSLEQLEEVRKGRETTNKEATSIEQPVSEHNSVEASQSAPDTEQMYCAKCDIKFMSRRAYNLHFFKSDNHDDGDAFAILNSSRTNHASRPKIPTSCEHCDKDFPSRQAYKKHHQAEHAHIPLYIPDERDICEICGASIQASSIQYHMKSHTGERNFTCPAPQCGITFTLKSNMKRHYNVKHLGIVYPKYIRKNPGRRKKKTEQILDNDFSPLVRTRTGYFL